MLETFNAHVGVRECQTLKTFFLGELLAHDLVKKVVLFVMTKLDLLAILREFVVAMANHFFWRTLYVDADLVFELYGDDRHLIFGVETKLSLQSGCLFGLDDRVHRDLSGLKPLEKRDFSSIADRDVESVFVHLDVTPVVEDD
jgi:hypothetical protein